MAENPPKDRRLGLLSKASSALCHLKAHNGFAGFFVCVQQLSGSVVGTLRTKLSVKRMLTEKYIQ